MLDTFTTGEKIRMERENMGISQDELGERTGISKSSISNYETKENDISHINLTKLADCFGVSTDYLVGRITAKNHLNSKDFSLNLSDNVIDMIKNEKINLRLLCELMEHPLFPLFLVDMEIFVDGLATMQIKNLNHQLAKAQRMIQETHNPPPEELYNRTLELAQIREESYFSGILQGDLMEILKSIRENHKTDEGSAPPDYELTDLESAVTEARALEGTEEEVVLKGFFAQTGLDYSALSVVERVQFIDLLKKSSKNIKNSPMWSNKHLPRKHTKKKR